MYYITTSQFITSISNLDLKMSILIKYSKWTHIFSKTKSDILPLYYQYNYKIELEREGEKSLKYSPLYKILTNELEAIKTYIIDNLIKGFIKLS